MLSEKRLRSIITDTVLQEMAIDPLYPSYQEYRQAEIIAEGLFGDIANKIKNLVKSDPVDIDQLLQTIADKITDFAEKIKKYFKSFVKKNANSGNQTNEWTERDIEWAFGGLTENSDPSKKVIQEAILATLAAGAASYAAAMAWTKLADLVRKLAGYLAKKYFDLSEEHYDVLSDDLLRAVGTISHAPDEDLSDSKREYRRKQLKRQAAQAPFVNKASESEFADGLTAKGDAVRTHRNLVDQQHHLDHDLEKEMLKKMKGNTSSKKDRQMARVVWFLLKWKQVMHKIEGILDTPFKMIAGVITSIFSDKIDDSDATEEGIFKWTKGSFIAWALWNAFTHLLGYFTGHGADHAVAAVDHGTKAAKHVTEGEHGLYELIQHFLTEAEEFTQLFTLENLTHTEGVVVHVARKGLEIGEDAIVFGTNIGPAIATAVSKIMEKGHEKWNQHLDDTDASGALERMDAWSGRDQMEEAIQRILNKRALHA